MIKYDDKRLYIEDGGLGNNLTATAYSKRGDIHIRCEEPWSGDSETGFGAVSGFTLPREEAIALANWILAATSTTTKGDSNA